MPDVKPERWNSGTDRDIDPESGVTVPCNMFDVPVMTLDDPILNPPEETA
jgi:hypothetical protein